MTRLTGANASAPAAELWGDPGDDWDLRDAMELFLGKTNDDVTPLLAHNYTIRALDLALMPDPVFNYYCLGFADFLFREQPHQDDFGFLLGCFLCATEERLEFWRTQPTLLQQLADKLAASETIEEIKEELTEELNHLRQKVQGL